MYDFTIFNEMTLDEIEMYLEKGEVPVRVTGKLPKDTGYHKGQGETPIRTNAVEKRKGYDELDPEIADLDDFLDEIEADDITLKKSKYMMEACCKKEEKCDKIKTKKLVEPNEVEEDSETLEEDFDIDAEMDALLAEDADEMKLLDEELEDIESFLESYID